MSGGGEGIKKKQERVLADGSWRQQSRFKVASRALPGPASDLDFRPFLGRHMAPLVLPEALGHTARDNRLQTGLKLGQTLDAAGDPGGFEGRFHTVILSSTKRFVNPD
jgi:hypothetical protein